MSHAGYIFAAYGFTALVVGALIVWALLGYRAQRRELAALEQSLSPQGGERPARGAG